MKDLCLLDGRIFNMISAEEDRQVKKWGIQNRTPFEWMAYLTEEVGELAKAISEHEYRGGFSDDVVREAIQTATLAAKIAEMYLNQKHPWRSKPCQP